MKGEPVKYTYNTQLEWAGAKKGILKCKGKPDIVVACPPEFGGHPSIWSPEDLFLASVEVCIMTTVLWFTNKEDLTLKFYKSEAVGNIELVAGVFQFRSITIKVKINVLSEEDSLHVKKILKKVKHACLISNSIETDVNIEPEIVVD
jgi:organic hydroperoxide reductase OsmC/OhrA